MFDIDRMITMADDCEEAIGLLQKRDKSTDQMYNLPKKHREIKEGEIYLSIAEAGRDMMKNLADGSEDAVSTESGQMEKSKYIVPVIRKTRSFDVANLDIASLYKRQAINEDMEKPVKSVTAETAVEEGVTFLDQVFSKESRFFEEKSSTDTSKSDKKVKRGGGIMNNLGMTLSEKDDKVSALMAELMKSKERLALVNKQLYVYDQENGCFELCCKDVAAMRIRSLIPKELRNRISFSEYKQAYQLLTISEEIAKKDDFFAYNTHYVNCKNGVYDALRGTLDSHSHKYRFTNCLEANYDPKANCPRWLNYLHFITGGDPELKALWRAVLGYLLSNYNNAKVAILIYGASYTGKSVMCNLIERFFGSSKVSHVDISMFDKPEFTAHTAGKVLNIVPDLNNKSLADVGRLKSLISHLDTQSVRFLYGNPVEVKSQTKMVLSTNHFLTFDVKKCSAKDVEAVFNRLLYILYVNPPVPKSEMNHHLADQLWEERDGILTWAMRGLQDYLDLGENFPYAEKSEELKARNVAQYCPEMVFVDRHIVVEEGAWISTRELRDVYDSFCRINGISTQALNVLTYIENHLGIKRVRGRVLDDDGNERNCWHYRNLRLLWEPVETEENADEEEYDEDEESDE